jgi:hypothetical protein
MWQVASHILHIKNTANVINECAYFSNGRQNVGRDSSVGIANRYGLDGPGIECRWWRDFLNPSRRALGPTNKPGCWVFPVGKAAGASSSSSVWDRRLPTECTAAYRGLFYKPRFNSPPSSPEELHIRPLLARGRTMGEKCPPRQL